MADGGEENSYLLLFEATGARLARLPADGVVTLGSGAAADVRLADASVAEVHLRLECAGGTCRVVPADAASPVRINDRPVVGARVLAPGDVVGVGAVSLVLQHEQQRADAPLLERGAWRARLREETDRARRYDRPYALLLLDLGDPSPDTTEAAAGQVREVLRAVDIVGREGEGELAALLPETAGSATIPACRVLEALHAVAPAARVGVALFPDDGSDGDALLLGARGAARAARPGGWAGVADGAARLEVDERLVLYADPKMRRLFALVEALADGTLPVLIEGETGVGKEIVARTLHAWSPRRTGPLITVDCSSLPDALLENELFGHERGAFSGADQSRPGLVEAADGGTLFLDEVGDSSPRTQAELLRVVETGRVRRLGAVVERPVDLRLVAASNRALEREVAAGRFRRDLFFRLRGVSLVVPPLRERRLEIPLLARMFLDETCRAKGRTAPVLSPAVLHALARHPWPGNVRELRHTMQGLGTVVREPVLGLEHLPESLRPIGPRSWRPSSGAPGAAPAQADAGSRVRTSSLPPGGTEGTALAGLPRFRDEVARLERRLIRDALAAAGGVRVRAAQLIGMPLRTLTTKLKLYGLTDPEGGKGTRSRR